MSDLQTITELSHEFGTPYYVKGGGGNTSVKNETTLWVKPSGTTLSGLTTETFVAMNRAKIDDLYGVETPADPDEREELVKNLMAAAVEEGSSGRPSVEAPLHNILEAKYVVHTHPVLVNGLTCALEGESACKRLFPEALWVEYIDPGYTLCMEVQKRIEHYKAEHGKQPALIVLQNHGIFVSADTPEDIRTLYTHCMGLLEAVYKEQNVSEALEIADTAASPETEALIQTVLGEDAAAISSSGRFAVAPGPLTPDHLVYAKAFPYTGAITPEGVAAYRAERGYAPKVIVTGERVYGLGSSGKHAGLALEFAQDAALVFQLTGAFGGVNYMTDSHRIFIENWEVESYRQQQA